MASSRNVLICLAVILSFSTLSLTQTNGQKTKKTLILPKPSIELDPDSELGSESGSDTDSDLILPLELDWASKPSMAPVSGQKPGSQQKLTPQPSASDPKSTTHPKASMAAPSSETEEPEDDPAPSSEPNPSPVPTSEPKPSPGPSSKPKPTAEPSSAPTESEDDPNSTTGPSPEQNPTKKSAPAPKQGSKSVPPTKETPSNPTKSFPPTEETPSNPDTKPTIPYQTVNNFCLYKRLSVNRIFCLKVLKNPSAANATANDYTPLLQVATKATTCHVIKTLKYLKTLYKDKKTDPAQKSSIRECVIAYQEIAEYIKLVLADASQESAIAGLDGEVIVEDINRCVGVVPKIKNTEIGQRNQISKNYAKLLVDIADNP